MASVQRMVEESCVNSSVIIEKDLSNMPAELIDWWCHHQSFQLMTLMNFNLNSSVSKFAINSMYSALEISTF